jgi:tetratricopeptide (TPR) repeat protein
MTPGKGRRTAVVIVVATIAVLGVVLASFVYLRRGETAQGGRGVKAWPARPAAAAAPDLALSGSIIWDHVYEGDPLWIRARIDSPRERQLFNEAADRRARRLPATPVAFTMPAVRAEWGTAVTMRLAVIDAGGRAAPVFDGEAARFLVQARRDRPFPSLDIDELIRVEDWMLPAESTAGLRAGRYELTLASPDATHPLRATPIRYDVVAPGSGRQRAEHLEHLAQYEFLQGRLPRARELAEEALRLDPDGFDPHRADTLLLIAQVALQMNDRPAAVAAYRTLLARLPPASQNDLAVYVTDELARLSR